MGEQHPELCPDRDRPGQRRLRPYLAVRKLEAGGSRKALGPIEPPRERPLEDLYSIVLINAVPREGRESFPFVSLPGKFVGPPLAKSEPKETLRIGSQLSLERQFERHKRDDRLERKQIDFREASFLDQIGCPQTPHFSLEQTVEMIRRDRQIGRWRRFHSVVALHEFHQGSGDWPEGCRFESYSGRFNSDRWFFGDLRMLRASASEELLPATEFPSR